MPMQKMIQPFKGLSIAKAYLLLCTAGFQGQRTIILVIVQCTGRSKWLALYCLSLVCGNFKDNQCWIESTLHRPYPSHVRCSDYFQTQNHKSSPNKPVPILHFLFLGIKNHHKESCSQIKWCSYSLATHPNVICWCKLWKQKNEFNILSKPQLKLEIMLTNHDLLDSCVHFFPNLVEVCGLGRVPKWRYITCLKTSSSTSCPLQPAFWQNWY